MKKFLLNNIIFLLCIICHIAFILATIITKECYISSSIAITISSLAWLIFSYIQLFARDNEKEHFKFLIRTNMLYTKFLEDENKTLSKRNSELEEKISKNLKVDNNDK